MSRTATAVETTEEVKTLEHTGVVLKLRKPKPASRRKVVWREDTVDNEHMNKKKSKCCCIYEKPKAFGESSSESNDDETDCCRGHVERRQKSKPVSTEVEAVQQAEGHPVVAEASGDRPEERRHVMWSEDTVDNENMNKKSSKCCCIYQKPKKFDESSSESEDDDCGQHRGHVERKKKHCLPVDDDNVEM
ncbi:uncharacterized protein LOC135391253 [Ornithodoros turicata]